jgi:iron complex transport system substrate-binding protein
VLHRAFALIALVLALLVAACGSDDAVQPAETAGTTSAAVAFPVTIEAENGSVEIAQRPERIVSLSATATETLFAIEADEQVIAVDDQSNYPEDAPHTKLSGFQPNVEAIAGYEPDLVIAAFDPGDLVSGLGKLDIPVLLYSAPKDLDGAYEQMEALGDATGHAEEAGEVVDGMRSDIDALVEDTAGAEGATVYHELGPDFFSATSETFIGSVYELFGLVNIADAATEADAGGYPQLTGEYIVSESPDLIVLADTKCCEQTVATVSGRPGWDQIEAVQHGDIVEADDDIASRWGPRTVEFVELIAQSLEGIGSR